MRVGIGLLTLLPGSIGGSETLVRGLLTGLAAGLGDRAGDQTYSVFTNAAAAPSLEPFDRGPVGVQPVPGFRAGSGSTTRLLAIGRGRYLGRRLARSLIARAGTLDVVHYALTVSIPPLDRPRVITVYDLQHELMPELFSVTERAYRRVFYAGAISRADIVMTISEFSKQTIVDRHGLDPERVIVSRQGIDRTLFAPSSGEDDDALLAQFELPERYVIYPANLWPHKNHDRLLEAFALARDRELSLVLTGAQYGRWPKLEARSRQLGLGGRVRHLGYVERKALPALYRRALGTVFPSLFEGMGIPPLEALSCGCQVAAARVAALPEVLGGHAIWFDALEPAAIAAAIDRLAGGESLAMPPAEFWDEFTWDRNASIHRDAYARARGES